MEKTFIRCSALLVAISLIVSCFCVSYASSEENVQKQNKVIEYYPYSKWANDLAIKHKLVLNQNPKRNAKKWEVASIVYLLMDNVSGSVVKEFSDTNDVSDVVRSRINAISSKGIIKGYEDNTFRPFNDITRAEFCTILDRSDLLKQTSQMDIQLNDINTHWAKEAILNVARSGLMSGKGDGIFAPDANITIEEIFVIMDRMLKSDSAKIQSVMLDVFGGKVYGEEDAFVFEDIYCNVDEIQNKMRATWFDLQWYDYTPWWEIVTVKDIVPFLYNCYGGITRRHNDDEKASVWQQKIDLIREAMGFAGTQEELLNEQITMDDFMKIYYRQIIDSSDPRIMRQEIKDMVKFKNLNNLDEKYYLTFVYLASRNKLVFSENMFQDDIYLNKLILNYFITNEYYSGQIPYTVQADYTVETLKGVKDWRLVLDPSKLPGNYSDLTYVLQHIPKEIYEIPFAFSHSYDGNQETNFANATPRQVYEKSTRYWYWQVYSEVKKHFDVMLNVDYRTIDGNTLYEQLKDITESAGKNYIFEYAQYVKDNRIILEGSAEPVYGLIYLSDGSYRTRVIVKFKIISSDTDTNIMLYDKNYYNTKEVKYGKTEYDLCVEMPLYGQVDYDQFKIGRLIYQSVPFMRHVSRGLD